MVIHFLMVNLPHFCGGLKAQHVLITVAKWSLATIAAVEQITVVWSGPVMTNQMSLSRTFSPQTSD